MNMGYSYNRADKLHSPLLDGRRPQRRSKYNEKQYSQNIDESVDDTLDLTLFDGKKSNKQELSSENINYSFIEALETLFKIAGALVLAIGGLFCILELVKIIRLVQVGTSDITTDLIMLAVVFIATMTANAICMGFNHLVKTTRYLYIRIDSQNIKLEKLLKKLNSN